MTAGPRWITVGAVFCGLAVTFGAFAAHGLDPIFTQKYAGGTRVVGGQSIPQAAKFLTDFKTGAEYQMSHGLAVIASGLMIESRRSRAAHFAAMAFSLGIILFSGSLYVLTLTGITKWGMVTPIGGLAFLVGWLLLAVSAFGKRSSPATENGRS